MVANEFIGGLGESLIDGGGSRQDESDRLHKEDVHQRADDGTRDVRVRQPAERVLFLADALSFPPYDDRGTERPYTRVLEPSGLLPAGSGSNSRKASARVRSSFGQTIYATREFMLCRDPDTTERPEEWGGGVVG